MRGQGKSDGFEAGGGVRRRGGGPPRGRPHRPHIPHAIRRAQARPARQRPPEEHSGDSRLGRGGPVRRPAGKAGERARDRHVRVAQLRPREGPRRGRAHRLQGRGRGARLAREPLGEEVRRGGALRAHGGVVGVRAEPGRKRRRDRFDSECGNEVGFRGEEADVVEEEVVHFHADS